MKTWSSRFVPVLAGALLIGFPVTLTLAVPATAGETKKLGIDAQSWYITPVSTCTLPVGCPPAPVPQSVSPFPKGTLHIGVKGGQGSAHAYVKPDLDAIPIGASMRSGTMTLPVTQDLPLGNAQVETAAMVGCAVTEPITDGVEGGITQPPTFDCDEASEPVKIQKGAKSFSLDLAPFLRLWSTGAPALGIALVPAPDQQPDANWRVTLNGKDSEATPRISATVAYVQQSQSPTPEPSADPTPPPTGGEQVSPPIGVPEIGPAPKEGTTPPVASAEPPRPELSPEPQHQAARLVNMPWYSYGGVVYLPLVLLVVAIVVARSLTRPLTARPLSRAGMT